MGGNPWNREEIDEGDRDIAGELGGSGLEGKT
jgi:hypothetical protein